MDKSLLKSPLVIVIIAVALALIPLLFDSENMLVLLRLLSFVMFFYAIHLFTQKRKVSK